MAAWRRIRFGVAGVIVASALAGALSHGQDAATDTAKGAENATGESRTWTDITGKFSREAVFLKLEEGKVHLRLASGKEISIPLKELSKKDRDWVRSGAAVPSGPEKPVGSRIVLRSYKAIVDDSVILSQALQQQALAGAVPALFVALTGGKPLDGFDTARPIVATVHVDAQGQPAGTVVAVPVQGKEKFQKTLDTVFQRKTTPSGRGYEIPTLGTIVFAKPGDSYFLLSDDAELVRRAAADPPAPAVVADVAMESFNAGVSEEVREAGLAQFEAMLSAAPVSATLPAGALRSRDETVKVLRAVVRALATDAERSLIEASVDPTTKGVSLAFSVRARSGTPMAETMATYAALRPGFVAAGGEGGSGWAGVSLPAGDWIRMALETVLGEGVRGMKDVLARMRGQPGYKEAEAALADVEAGMRQLMAVETYEQEVLFSMDESGTPRVVTRIAFAQARELLASFGKLLAVGSPEGMFAPDADGIVSMPMQQAQPGQVGGQSAGPFGAHPVRLAASADSLVIGFGCGDGAPVKAMLAGSPAGTQVAPVSLRIDLAELWPTLAAANPLTASLGDAVGERGMVRADIGPLSDGIEFRMNIDDGVLRLLGAVAAASANARGAGMAQGFPGTPGFRGAPGPGGPALGGVPKGRALPGPGGPPTGPPANQPSAPPP